MVSCEKILETAKKERVDIIGLSGLITPSLEEMVHVSKEMQRLKYTCPLLIGGATTSRAHTALKIEPHYEGAVIHVVDASRAVGVASQLLGEASKVELVSKTREEYAALRTLHQQKKSENQFVSIKAARANKFKGDWDNYRPQIPRFTGTKSFKHYPLKKIMPYIDWTPFFATWELSGRYPQIFQDEVVGESAKSLFDDAQIMLQKIVSKSWLIANAMIGFFPANSVGDDIEIYENEDRDRVLMTFRMLRQQTLKSNAKPNFCLADFIAPKSSGIPDYLGGFAVTAGGNIDEQLKLFENEHDDYQAIMLKALADRLAEGFAEHMHERVRKEFWSYAQDETLSNDALIAEKYVGIRPAPGYPACPDHTEKPALFDLLKITETIGISLTENFAMLPASSVSGFYFSHPNSTYFGVGKINEDQVIDYAERKGMEIAIIKRWLSPHLV
jgi:5-methyltetrahydrofolate--homocysteine methyltransferase